MIRGREKRRRMSKVQNVYCEKVELDDKGRRGERELNAKRGKRRQQRKEEEENRREASRLTPTERTTEEMK